MDCNFICLALLLLLSLTAGLSPSRSRVKKELFLSNLLFQMSLRHSFQYGATLGFGFWNCVLDTQSDQLFELIRFPELPEVQILQ